MTAAPIANPFARALRRTLMAIFCVGLVTFLASGALLVILQIAGIVVGNTELTVNTIPGLHIIATAGAGVTGILAFGMSYLFGWSNGED